MSQLPNPPTGKNIANAVCNCATAAAGNFLSAGDAAAVSGSARRACRKTYGACPAMGLPGSARIAGIRTDSETSRNGAGTGFSTQFYKYDHI